MIELNLGRPKLLVMASTYPRWMNDHEPGFVHELARRLSRDFEVHVSTPHAAKSHDRELLDGVEIHRYRYAPERLETLVSNGGLMANLRQKPWKWLLVPFFLIGLMRSTVRLVRELQPDVIHAHWILPQGLAVAAMSLLCANTPAFLLTSHGGDLYMLRGRVFEALKRWVLRQAAGVTVVSEAMRDEALRLGVASDRLHVQPMGVDLLNTFIPDALIQRSRSEILFVGRLVEKKGLRFLIESMPAVLFVHPSAFLSIVGFGPEREYLELLVNSLNLQDSVRFLGPQAQSELPKIYQRAALFVAPFVKAASGDQEGLGLVAIEAAGCGCSIVLSDLPATRDIDCERVPPGSPTALADAIIRRLSESESDRCRRSDLLRLQLIERFDWGTVTEGYATRLRSIGGLYP